MEEMTPEEIEIQTLRLEVSNLLTHELNLEFPALLSVTPASELVGMTSSLRLRLGQLQSECIRLARRADHSEEAASEMCEKLHQTEDDLRAAEATVEQILKTEAENELYEELYENERKYCSEQQEELGILRNQLSEYAQAGQFNAQMTAEYEEQQRIYANEKRQLVQQISDLEKQIAELEEFRGGSARESEETQYTHEVDAKEFVRFQIEVNRLEAENRILKQEVSEFGQLLQNNDPEELVSATERSKELADRNEHLEAQIEAYEHQEREADNLKQENAKVNDLMTQLRNELHEQQEATQEITQHAEQGQEEVKRLRDGIAVLKRALVCSERETVLLQAGMDEAAFVQLNQSFLEEKQALVAFLNQE